MNSEPAESIKPFLAGLRRHLIAVLSVHFDPREDVASGESKNRGQQSDAFLLFLLQSSSLAEIVKIVAQRQIENPDDPSLHDLAVGHSMLPLLFRFCSDEKPPRPEQLFPLMKHFAPLVHPVRILSPKVVSFFKSPNFRDWNAEDIEWNFPAECRQINELIALATDEEKGNVKLQTYGLSIINLLRAYNIARAAGIEDQYFEDFLFRPLK